MSAPPLPSQPAYPVPPPLPPQPPGSPYYNPYAQYQGFPPPAPQPYEAYPPPTYDQKHTHPPHHNQGQSSSSQHMYPRPVYSIPPKVSNAIYVKNLLYALSVDEFLSIFSKFGEIATKFTSKISTRGFAFVTYYDIRSAINAIEQMKDQKIHNRQPVVMFSFNPPEYARLNAHETSTIVLVKPVENNSNNSSTDNQINGSSTTQSLDQKTPAFNMFFDTNQNLPLDSDSVTKSLSAFGEIYKTTDLGNNQFVVQFYDLRNAHNAIASSDKITIRNQKVILESFVEPDEGVSYENAPAGYNPQTQSYPPQSQGYPQPYQVGSSNHQTHGNNQGGNKNNRNNRNNSHGNRHGNHHPPSLNNQLPYQPQPPPSFPPPYISQQLQQMPPQITSPQLPVAPTSIPPSYTIQPPPPPPTGAQFQQGTPPPMQYMMQYPQGIPPPPPPVQ